MHEGFDVKKLEDCVSHRGATLVLIKSGVGWVAGGYASVPWRKGSDT